MVNLFLLLAIAASAENWPQWRGPDSAGTSSAANLPSEWSAAGNIAWKTPIPGNGHSSPVIWGDRIFLTTSIEGAPTEGAKAPAHRLNGQPFVHPSSVDAERIYVLQVLAVDRRSGKILWTTTAFEGKVYDARHKKNTYATPTPVTDGKRVYVSFESQGIYAFDFNGKLLWKASAGNIKTVGMGPATSPVLAGDILLLQCDQDEGEDSFLVAFSTRNGEMLWKQPRKVQVGWSTPLLFQSQLITTSSEATIAYDPRTGKELWRGPGVANTSVPSLVAGHGLVFVSAGYPQKKIIALKTGAGAGQVAWQYDKGPGYVPSPILYGDYLYVMSDRGLITCFDARTGKVAYEGGRPPVPATFSSSPVAFDGKLFLTSEDGDTYVIQAGPEHKVLRTNALGEPVFASIAIGDGALFLRGARNLYCIRASQ